MRYASVFLLSLRGRANGKWHIESHCPTQAKGGLDPDFLPRCAREIRGCAFHLRKSVSTPQASTGNRGNRAPRSCVREGRTAGPSASLGMTNWRAALILSGGYRGLDRGAAPRSCVRERRTERVHKPPRFVFTLFGENAVLAVVAAKRLFRTQNLGRLDPHRPRDRGQNGHKCDA